MLVQGMLACARSRSPTPVEQISWFKVARTKQTFWTEDQFVATASSRIRDCDKRVAEIVARELEKAKPGKWGYVQARELWSPKGETHICPGHT